MAFEDYTLTDVVKIANRGAPESAIPLLVECAEHHGYREYTKRMVDEYLPMMQDWNRIMTRPRAPGVRFSTSDLVCVAESHKGLVILLLRAMPKTWAAERRALYERQLEFWDGILVKLDIVLELERQNRRRAAQGQG